MLKALTHPHPLLASLTRAGVSCLLRSKEGFRWRYLNSGRPKHETALSQIGYPSSQAEGPGHARRRYYYRSASTWRLGEAVT